MGIIFVVGDQILIESTPVSEGEAYGDCMGHARGHEQFWADLQEQGHAPGDEEYIGIPRGRALFSKRTGQYLLLLDRCILRQPKLVREIRRRMNLPIRSMQISKDDHYRCKVCMGTSRE